MYTYHWIKKLMSLIISSIKWNYKPYDLSGLFLQYTIPDCATIRKTRRSRRLARETFLDLYPLVMKKNQITVTQRFFHRLLRRKILNSPHTAWALKTAIPYFEIKITATRTAPKKKQYGNTANLTPPSFLDQSLSVNLISCRVLYFVVGCDRAHK